MSSDLVIIIATYNYARFLAEAVDSALNQTFAGSFEIVVVDDGSTDETPELIAKYADSGHVRYIRQENAGQSVAFNNAIANTASDFIMFFDADDLLLDHCVERTVAFLKSRENLGLVFSDYEVFDAHGTVHPSGIGTWKNFRSIPHSVVREDHWVFTGPLTPHIIKYGSFMPTSSLTVKRSLLSACSLFPEGCAYGGETDFCARYALHCESGYIDQVLSRKRDHPESIIHNDSRRVEYAACNVEISEAQLHEFREHPELVALLHRLLAVQTVDFGWGLLEAGRRKEALRVLRKYTRRYPRNMKLYRLWAKYLLRLRSSRNLRS
ncbi:MAG: glycosyltransferase [Candidatus Eisenbacteria sp.]|nr:glycosyltransferase [Candidatus Eisenbacteria bacterium]